MIGKLQDFKLIEILQLLSMNQKTGILTIYHDFDEGQIIFESGQITYAKFQNFSGEQAVQKITTWKKGVFLFDKVVVKTEKNIDKPTMQLILDCCQMLDESEATSLL